MTVQGAPKAAIVVLALAFMACPAPKQLPAGLPGRGPATQATVLTLHTEILPEKKAFDSLIVDAGDKIRLGEELDHWRLINLTNDTVTFVDDVARTFRTVRGDSLLRDRATALNTPLPSGIPRATIERTGVQRVIRSWNAHQYLIRLGAYRRELWISEQPLLGPRFLPLMAASEPLGDGYPGVMRDVQMELIRSAGVPVWDHGEIPLGREKLVVDRRLLHVEKRAVPLRWVTVPPDYRDITPPLKGSGAGRPPASSPPAGQRAPAKG